MINWLSRIKKQPIIIPPYVDILVYCEIEYRQFIEFSGTLPWGERWKKGKKKSAGGKDQQNHPDPRIGQANQSNERAS
jgi:hypothetical protein